MFSAILLVQNDDAGAVLERLAIESKQVPLAVHPAPS